MVALTAPLSLRISADSPSQPAPLGRIGDADPRNPRLVAECFKENRGRLIAALLQIAKAANP